MNWFGKLFQRCKAAPIPDDPRTGKPYFTVPKCGWGSGWQPEPRFGEVPPAAPPKNPSGPPAGRIQRHEYGVIDTTPMCSPASFKLNAERSVAVATDYFWNEDMSQAPRGVKLQLLGRGGVAVYGHYDGKDAFWTAWAPCPKMRSPGQ